MPDSPVLHRAYLGLGSNCEAARHLPAAVEELAELGSISAVSNVYESAAVGDESQPDYLNAAVLLLTERSAEQLYQNDLPVIELRLGRVRDPHNKNAPRTIDIDLVLFDDIVRAVDHRRIPDPDIMERAFLAVPLAEIDADYVHPETGERMEEIANRVRKICPKIKRRPDVILRPPS